jgi:hypothetical protein
MVTLYLQRGRDAGLCWRGGGLLHHLYCDQGAESIATLPPFCPIEGHKWFFQISSQCESQKNRFALISFWQNPVFTSLHLRSPVQLDASAAPMPYLLLSGALVPLILVLLCSIL